MQSSVLTTIFLPAALGIIMLGLGLSLTIADFKRVVVYPRAVIVGLVCQMLLLPVVCYGLAIGFNLPPELAVGLMLLAASPGGATANLFSHLAHGDVALNITLTAVNSLLSLLTLPFIVNFADRLHGRGQDLAAAVRQGRAGLRPRPGPRQHRHAGPCPPPAAGQHPRQAGPHPLRGVPRADHHCDDHQGARDHRRRLRLRRPGRAVLQPRQHDVGYGLPRLLRLDKRQSIAIGMEIGIHNGTLAIAIASTPTLLNNSTMAIPPAIYSLIMFFTAGLFGYLVSRGRADRR
jgi:BASS family bile acid:Na+ symporter